MQSCFIVLVANFLRNGKISLMILQHYVVKGKVQGVGFRAYVQAQAVLLGAQGWVRNLNDGSVEVFINISTEKISEFKDILMCGPMLSEVESVEDYKVLNHQHEFSDFEIISDGEGIWQS